MFHSLIRLLQFMHFRWRHPHNPFIIVVDDFGSQSHREWWPGYKGTLQLGIELKETMKFQLKF